MFRGLLEDSFPELYVPPREPTPVPGEGEEWEEGEPGDDGDAAPREEADRRRADERETETVAAADSGAGADASAGPSLSIADRMTSGTGEVSASTQHEKLMEQYINEQMGIGAEDAYVNVNTRRVTVTKVEGGAG